MGIASWRARVLLREFAQAAAVPGGALRIKAGNVQASHPGPSDLNEVGVTDAVSAALWRHAPEGATYVVTSAAETLVFGGDLAIVHGDRHLRIYQAKLVTDTDPKTGEYVLKSPLTQAHATLLNTGTFTWRQQTWRKTGYLALYQTCLSIVQGTWHIRRSTWWAQAAASFQAPHLGGVYYWDMMAASRGKTARMASARGIMAAPVPPSAATGSLYRVPIADSWPWEYGVANVWSGPASVVPPSSSADDRPDTEDIPPSMPKPVDDASSPVSAADAPEFAQALFEELYGDAPARLTVVFV
jgi:hypothetical protein